MQVKKFEAENIVEALALVKNTLGPDAIILSAKENNSNYGIAGKSSIEVTAAVSENRLKVKQYAESKLSTKDKEVFMNSPASRQRDFIEKAVKSAQEEFAQKNIQFTKQRYIDIEDEPLKATSQESLSPEGEPPLSANHRIKDAVKEAWEAVQHTTPVMPYLAEGTPDSELVTSLKKEIEMLKGIINNFKSVPQNFLNLHPGAANGVPYELSGLYERLTKLDVSDANAIELVKLVEAQLSPEQRKKRPYVDAFLAKYFLKNMPLVEDRYEGKYHLFVGPHSQGKTSSLIKLASEMVIGGKRKIAVLTTDTQKLGAVDQLRIFCKILNVPFASVANVNVWTALQDKLSQFDHVLVDFRGSNFKTITEMNQMNQFKLALNYSSRTHYVQSIVMKEKESVNIAQRFRAIGFDDVIFTHLDEPQHCGTIYNFQQVFNVPVHSFSIGPQIPEDFEAATRERFVDLLFNLSHSNKKEVING